MNRLTSYVLLLCGLLLTSACNFGEPTTVSGGGTGVEGLSGQIVGPDGGAAPGTKVKIYPILFAGLGKPGVINFPVADSVTVGANGSFSFPNLAPGTYNLLATIKRGDTTLALLVTGIIVTNKGTDLGTDTLKLTGKITLNVATGGTPLEGANCYLPYTPFAAVSDSTGQCTLAEVPTGTFEITVIHSGFQVGISGDISVLPGLLTSGGIIDLVSTVAGPPAPAQIFPAAEAILTDADDGFVWFMSGEASRYHLQVTSASDTNFTAPLLNNPNLTESYAPITHRVTGQSYRWRVRAGNAAVFGAWSTVRTYSVSAGPLAASHFAVTPSTLALWTFNDVDENGRLLDISGKGNHIIPTSGFSLPPSTYGNSILFAGSRMTIPNASMLSIESNDTLTYEARIWLDAYPSASLWNGGSALIGQYTGLKLMIDKDGRIQAAAQSGDGADWFWYPPVSDVGVVPLGRWVNVAVSAVRNGSQLYAYVDNVPVAVYNELTPGSTLRPSSTSQFPFTIGNDGQDNQPFPGRVDEIRISKGLPLGPGVTIKQRPPGL